MPRETENTDLDKEVFHKFGVWVVDNGKDDGQSEAAKTITAGSVVDTYGVPRKVVEEYLTNEIVQDDSCKLLPFNLLLLFAYAATVITHENAPAVAIVEESIIQDIANNADFAFSAGGSEGGNGFGNYEEIHLYDDFWSWMNLGFMPNIFDADSPGEHINYNRIVGGIRVSQTASEAAPCDTYPALVPVYNTPCVGGQGAELTPEQWDAQLTSDADRKGVEYFYLDEDANTTRGRLVEMEASKWLNNRTMKIEIAIPIYNGEYGLYTLMHINFFFSRGGRVWRKLIPLSNFAFMQDTKSKIAYEILLCSCLLWMLWAQVRTMGKMMIKKGIFKFIADYFCFESAAEWFGVLFGTTIIVMFGFLYGYTDSVNTIMVELGKMQTNSSFTPDDFRNDFENKLFPKFDTSVQFCSKLRVVMALYPLVILYRLFKSFTAQPRLAVVTRSLDVAMVDLYHFLIVFISILAIFSISALTMFGKLNYGYTTIVRTIQSVFLAALGVFDWEELKVVGSLEAGAWFWMFMGLVTLILFNMLIAIVMDAYNVVQKQNSGRALTVFQDSRRIWKRYRLERRKKLVPLKKVEVALELKVIEMFEHHMLGLDDLDIGKKTLSVAEELAAGNDQGSLNDDGVPVKLGWAKDRMATSDEFVEEGGDGTDKYYCGRQLGVKEIPGSTGQCGPRNGPQCKSCMRYQAALVEAEAAKEHAAAKDKKKSQKNRSGHEERKQRLFEDVDASEFQRRCSRDELSTGQRFAG